MLVLVKKGYQILRERPFRKYLLSKRSIGSDEDGLKALFFS